MEGFSMEDKLRILKEVQDKEMADLEKLKALADQEEKEPEILEKEAENNPEEENVAELEKQLAQMKDVHRRQEEELQKKIESLRPSYTCSQCGRVYLGERKNFCGNCGNKIG